MRKILIILIITVGLLADDKEWMKYETNAFIAYVKYDKMLPFNYFGFLKQYDACKLTSMYLTFSTIDPEFKNIKVKDLMVKINFSNGEEKFSIKCSIYKEKFTENDILQGIVSINFLMGDKFLQFLKKSKNIEISIDKNDKIRKYFPFSTSHFNIEGFYKVYQKEYSQCLKYKNRIKKQ